MIEGQGRVLLGDELARGRPRQRDLRAGRLQHQYVNAGDTPFRFLCGIPTQRLMPQGALSVRLLVT